MPWISNNDGSATYFPWSDQLFLDHVSCGTPWWGTLLGAIQGGGVVASAFDHAMRCEPVYDTVDALAAFPGPLPAPVGVQAHYRVVYANGVTYYRGVHPSDLMKETAQ